MGFDFAGTYTKIVPHRLIEYAFGDRTAQVEFTTHSLEQQQQGWQSILDNFRKHVEVRAS